MELDGRNQKTGEQLDTSDLVPAPKLYPPQQSSSRTVVEEPPYNLERVVNDTDTVSYRASKTKACIVYPFWGDLFKIPNCLLGSSNKITGYQVLSFQNLRR